MQPPVQYIYVQTPQNGHHHNQQQHPQQQKQPQPPLLFGGMDEVKQAKNTRYQAVRGLLQEAGMDIEGPDSVPFEQQWQLFALDKCLRFYLCSDCIQFYINDFAKVLQLGGGYRMLTLVLCPQCVIGNNQVKSTTKMHFNAMSSVKPQ